MTPGLTFPYTFFASFVQSFAFTQNYSLSERFRPKIGFHSLLWLFTSYTLALDTMVRTESYAEKLTDALQL